MPDGEEDGSGFITGLAKPPSLLPIHEYRRDIVYTVETNQVTIILGETGCGKTTQVPQFLLQAGYANNGKTIGITQPRRLAVTSVAARVAQELQCNVGQDVGYAIRFEESVSESTRVKFLTDGLLIREIFADPLLSRYSVIIVDEAHERSISTDVLLSLIKNILRSRKDLRVIISSATLNPDEFVRFFTLKSEHTATDKSTASNKQPDTGKTAEPVVIEVPGRVHPIDVLYLKKPCEDYVKQAVKTVFDIHLGENAGDILVFLTGRDEIDDALQAVADRSLELNPNVPRLVALPLFAGLPTEEQELIFERTHGDARKVIFATNIAEASITIDGVVYVVDCGYVKMRTYNPQTSIEGLGPFETSKASADQRAGRAGRTKTGKCFRLYPESGYVKMRDFTVPELQRLNLTTTVLQLQALGVWNIMKFDYFSPPPAEMVINAANILHSLGAIDDDLNLTKPLGRRMAELPLEPMMAKALLASPDHGCLDHMLSIAAMTSLQTPVWIDRLEDRDALRIAQKRFAAVDGDHVTLLNVYIAFTTVGRQSVDFCRQNMLNFKSMQQAVNIRNQLRGHLSRAGVEVNAPDKSSKSGSSLPSSDREDQGRKVRRCLTTGFFAHVARMQPDGTFRTVGTDDVLHAHPTSRFFVSDGVTPGVGDWRLTQDHRKHRKSDWVLFQFAEETPDKTFIRNLSQIEFSWIKDSAPHYYDAPAKDKPKSFFLED